MSNPKKRKPAPELYDHNKKINVVRNFTRVRGGNSLIINSAHVTMDAPETVYLSHPSFAEGPALSDQDDRDLTEDHVPPNLDSAESVGIKVKAKTRYQNTVCILALFLSRR